MNDYALVLNAGSSSLKFSVFERSEAEAWHLASRGQIGGIGTSPRLVVKNGEGNTLADQKPDLDVHDGRDALNALAAWLNSTYGDAKVVGGRSWWRAVHWPNRR